MACVRRLRHPASPGAKQAPADVRRRLRCSAQATGGTSKTKAKATAKAAATWRSAELTFPIGSAQ
jgi:hypothetical protein